LDEFTETDIRLNDVPQIERAMLDKAAAIGQR
jgi:hypothetical protein